MKGAETPPPLQHKKKGFKMTNEQLNESKKASALCAFLGEQVNFNGATYETESGAEYEVLTDSEATEKAKEYILDSLWAFNADFILRHSANYETLTNDEYDSALDALKQAQERGAESLNGLVRCLIQDMDDFIADAICEDGLGHFIAFYDGAEIELDGGLFAYRVN